MNSYLQQKQSQALSEPAVDKSSTILLDDLSNLFKWLSQYTCFVSFPSLCTQASKASCTPQRGGMKECTVFSWDRVVGLLAQGTGYCCIYLIQSALEKKK